VVEALTLAAVLGYVKIRHGTYAQLGLTKPKLRDILYAVGGFFAYIVGLYFTLYVIVKPLFPRIDLAQHQDIGFGTAVSHRDLILTFISLVILPPLVEEIIFRGFLFGGLKRALPVVWAGIFTSLLFAAPHLLESDNGKLLWVAGVDTFVLSLVLVMLRHKTGRLYSGMLVHGAKNYLAFTYLYHATLFIR
jgi:membrane protease YdiL (CAAX protease family)